MSKPVRTVNLIDLYSEGLEYYIGRKFLRHQVKKTPKYLDPHEIISGDVKVNKTFIILNVLMSLVYLSWWFNFRNAGSPILFGLLLVGEIYHVWQAVGYSITIWNQTKTPHKPVEEAYPVDVFITVCGEPPEVVEKTLIAATSMDYPNFKVYILNDSFSRKLPGWQEINDLAEKYGAYSITRDNNKGFKAGNVNNALRQTNSPFIAVFDADHIPHKDFLQKTMGHFSDPEMVLVQTPQYYQNREYSFLTTAAWEQQELFFGPICRGKSNMNSTFWCGTNAVIRRSALEEIGGVPENNIAEDFLASYFFHANKKKTIYIAEILAQGLAPTDLANYVRQQFRWARGSSEIMFRHNPIFNKNLTWQQKVQYLYSSSYYLNGFIALLDAIIPIIVLATGIVPVNDTTANFVLYFFPFIFFTIALLMFSTLNTITYKAIQLSMSSSFVFIQAVLSALFRKKVSFEVTSKNLEEGNFLKFAYPHIAYLILGIAAITLGLVRDGFVPSTITNASWVIFNVSMLSGFIRVAYPWGRLFGRLKVYFYRRNFVPSFISNIEEEVLVKPPA